jgi:phosphate/sulfate permease
VILIRNICGETHAGSYGAIFVTTVLVPILGTIVALGLFQMFPDAATY